MREDHPEPRAGDPATCSVLALQRELNHERENYATLKQNILKCFMINMPSDLLKHRKKKV